MDTKVSISVVIATYHGEVFIQDQLLSLFRQTRIPDEILVGDDSRNNLTFDAVQKMLPQSPSNCSVRFFRNERRYGLVTNFSSLAGKAKGDIIFFCDQDDFWLPEKIEKISSIFLNNKNVDLVFCDSFYVKKDLSPTLLTNFDLLKIEKWKIDNINSRKSFLVFPNYYSAGHNIAIRKSACSYLLPFPHLFNSHDTWMTLFCSFLERCKCVPEPLTLHRIHENSTSGTETIIYHRSNLLGKISVLFSSLHDHLFHDNIKSLQLSKRWVVAVLETVRRRWHGEVPQSNLRYVQDLIRFYDFRINLISHSRFLRLPAVLHLDKYQRFASGLKSLLCDLIF